MNFNQGDVCQVEGRTGKFVYLWNKTPYSPEACSYNDDFQFIPLEKMVEKEFIHDDDRDILTIHVTGIHPNPNITKIENEPPFVIQREVRYNIRRKQPKQITIYE